ncbi:flagellar basal body L-ring protein FlgH [Sphingomonas glaciei]|uniref:Flagellar L-ring protein n=1 Tax=Sphingomonas glaciei TaxID=2938948 RepID=A0ABY5MSW4_9SPHN|nr:flagellar basal body L-ring protein FlgH [Sphingomonas glaciei]UUR07512.1 flagellar basal body L-ring protein FlgH [Sphingomonas glaciei]
MRSTLYCAALLFALGGCSVVNDVGNVGRAPRLSAPGDIPAPPTERSIATASLLPQAPLQSASLFREGSAGLLSDQRARGKGDLLTIRIKVGDNASFNNHSERRRGGTESAGIAGLLGIDKLIDRILPGKTPAASVDGSSDSRTSGDGKIERGETINLTLAAVVTDVLPNGNLLVRGRQEMRVNNELRELVVTGIVRPADIARDNSVPHDRIAEARVLYGGRGQLTSAQSARWGQQLYDALFPF